MGLNSLMLMRLVVVMTKLQVSPNPASSNLISVNMEFTNDVAYEIRSINGKLIKEGVLSNSDKSIDVSGLAPQVYFLKIDDMALKFVIKK